MHGPAADPSRAARLAGRPSSSRERLVAQADAPADGAVEHLPHGEPSDDAEAEQADPQNKLLHRMPIRRLEAEAIRDAMLAVSGRLDRTMYGPSVLPHLTPFMEGRGRPGRPARSTATAGAASTSTSAATS